jgi:hypothetical protein
MQSEEGTVDFGVHGVIHMGQRTPAGLLVEAMLE